MTVKELKELLNNYSEDAEVYFYDSDCGGALSLDFVKDSDKDFVVFDCC